MELPYRRVLLKLSGEALKPTQNSGIGPKQLSSIVQEIKAVHNIGVELAIVVGGGNILRGEELSKKLRIERATADYMGMLATVINSLALQDTLEAEGIQTRVMSAIEMHEVAEPYIRRRAVRHLEKGRVVIFAAGLGTPYFSTDTAAAQRALEIGAQVMLKATRVKGVFDRDPEQFPDAKLFKRISFNEAIAKNLGILDQSAFALCRENNLPIIVFNIFEPGNLLRVIKGEELGTLVGEE